MGGDERSLGLDCTHRDRLQRMSRVRDAPSPSADEQPGAGTGRSRSSPTLATRPVHGHRRPSRRRRFRAGRDRRPVDRRGVRRLARVLHQRRPGRRGSGHRSRSPWRRPARPSSGRPPRSWATPGVRSSTSPTAPWPTISPLRELLVREIRTFRPDAVLATDPEVDGLPRRRHQPHRPPGGRDRRGRRGLPGGAEPDGVPVARPLGAGRPQRPAPVPVLAERRRTPGSTSARRSTGRSPRCAPTPGRSSDPDGWRAHPRLGGRGGRADRGGGGRGVSAWSSIDGRRGARRGLRLTPEPSTRGRTRSARARGAAAGHGPRRSRPRSARRLAARAASIISPRVSPPAAPASHSSAATETSAKRSCTPPRSASGGSASGRGPHSRPPATGRAGSARARRRSPPRPSKR